ncbi:hypothetical protein C8R46DRAFT_1219368 [Mycena filopes]|nr:hypothetical protein C8R46DRAFT_1219368 [Mycena filopes]
MDSGLPTTLTRVEDLWIPRETIVIRAEDTIFQVPRAVLAAQSTVFREMLSFPQPPTPETELIDGSPVVRLHDAAKDVEVFLRAIFDASSFAATPADADLSTVLGILRLAHKYDVQFLYRRALDHLAEDGCTLRIATVALEVGALWLLPWAYYTSATHPSANLQPFIDGEFQIPARKALLVQTQLIRESLQVNRFLLFDDHCIGQNCRDIRRQYYAVSLHNVAQEVGNAGLQPFEEWNREQSRTFTRQACLPCAAHAIDSTRVSMTALFDKLPGMFGLPPWVELHAMKRSAMGEDDEDDENED